MTLEKKKILYVTNQMDPYAAITEFSKVARSLPQGMQEKGLEVRVFMPKYGHINERRHRLHEVIRLSGINIPVGDTDNPMIIKVASLPAAKMQIYFLDNDDYFHRKSYFTDDKGKFHDDNDERLIFFNKGAVEVLQKLGWCPDIIHCHGWLSSLVPLYAKTKYKNEPVFKGAKIVYSITDENYNETFGDGFVDKANLNGALKNSPVTLKNPGFNDLFITGANYADAVTVFTPDLDKEVSDFIDKLDKPVLKYQDADKDALADSYFKFYEKLFEND